MKPLIPQYPVGSNITIMNAMYLKPKLIETTASGKKKYSNGSMVLVYKDNNTNKKHHHIIDNPDYRYYIDENPNYSHNNFFIEKNELTEVRVPYKNLEKDIANRTGNLEVFMDNIYSGNRDLNRQLHYIKNIYNSDTHIEDHYRKLFAEQYTNEINAVTKAFLDIEVDISKLPEGINEPDPLICPINAVTTVFRDSNIVKVYLLDGYKNPSLDLFKQNFNIFKSTIKDKIRDSVGGWKDEIRYKIDKYKYDINFYDNEIEMIYNIFCDIHKYEPDFIESWYNFDFPYIINRIKALGYQAEDIMCDPRFGMKSIRFYVDERNKNDLAERGDYTHVLMYTTILDQCVHFASRRKGGAVIQSFALDYVGKMFTGVRKLNHDHLTFREFAYKDFELFVLYNIMDVIVQNCIEHKTEDVEYVFSKSIINDTRYNKCHRQTVYLVNRFGKEFKKDGLIIGNNVNKTNSTLESYPGAFLADPLVMDNTSKVQILGKLFLDLYNNCVDFDYASLYPSVLKQFNIAPNTMVGMIIIEAMIWAGENRAKATDYNRAVDFIENLHSRNYLLFCHRWLKMGSFMETYHDVLEYFNMNSVVHRIVEPNGMINPITTLNSKINPIRKINKSQMIQPISKLYTMNDNRVKEIITNARNNPKQSYYPEFY